VSAADHTGKRFGRLLVVSRSENLGGKPAWSCACDCGNTKIIRSSSLLKGDSRSCGCLASELTGQRATRHGMRLSTEYCVWGAMKKRVKDPKKASVYGHVSVCERWQNSFENFLADMGPRPSMAHSIDRKDNSRGYEPDNCRWATKTEQSQNRSTTVWIEARGMRLTATDWARKTGLTLQTILARKSRGIDDESVVSLPYRAATRKRLANG
jgi:hypothetical protein